MTTYQFTHTQVHCSLLFPIQHPFRPGQVLAVIHLANKADSFQKGFDDIDVAKVELGAAKLAHALVSIPLFVSVLICVFSNMFELDAHIHQIYQYAFAGGV